MLGETLILNGQKALDGWIKLSIPKAPRPTLLNYKTDLMDGAIMQDQKESVYE